MLVAGLVVLLHQGVDGWLGVEWVVGVEFVVLGEGLQLRRVLAGMVDSPEVLFLGDGHQDLVQVYFLEAWAFFRGEKAVY